MLSALILGLTLGPAPLEISVDGDGYLRFAKNARAVYAKSAKLAVKDGMLVHHTGVGFLPPIALPKGVTTVTVDLEGNVHATVEGSKTKVGRLVLAIFEKNAALSTEDAFLISPTRPTLGNPGEGLNGVIRTAGDKESTGARNAAVMDKPTTIARSTTVKEPSAPPKSAASGWKGAPHITVVQTTEVAADKFCLGDIAEVRAEADVLDELLKTPIGDTPCIGVSRGLDRGQIIARLRQAGFKTDGIRIEVPGGATVRRASQLIEADKFAEAAIAEVRKTVGPNLGLQADVPKGEFRAPTGEVKLAVESCVQNNQGYSAIVVVFVDGKRFNSRVIKIQPDQGSAVKAGQEVTVVLRANGAVVELSGKTRSSAFVGQTVTVGTKDGKTLSGVLVANNRVEVRL